MSAVNNGGTKISARGQKRARFEGSDPRSNKRRSTALAAGIAVAILVASAFFLLKGGDMATSVDRSSSQQRSAAGSDARPGASSGASAASAQPIAPEGDLFRIPDSSITTEARFFQGDTGTASVPFFAVRDAAGRVHVALDACQVCAQAKKGYVQRGDHMECRNCGKTFAIAQITEMGGRGGCHPIALASTTSGDSIVIKHSDVAAGAKWF